MTIDESFSPLLHRINDAVQQRALDPQRPPGPPAEILLRFAEPPAELVQASKQQLKNLITAADVKKGTSYHPDKCTSQTYNASTTESQGQKA